MLDESLIIPINTEFRFYKGINSLRLHRIDRTGYEHWVKDADIYPDYNSCISVMTYHMPTLEEHKRYRSTSTSCKTKEEIEIFLQQYIHESIIIPDIAMDYIEELVAIELMKKITNRY